MPAKSVVILIRMTSAGSRLDISASSAQHSDNRSGRMRQHGFQHPASKLSCGKILLDLQRPAFGLGGKLDVAYLAEPSRNEAGQFRIDRPNPGVSGWTPLRPRGTRNLGSGSDLLSCSTRSATSEA